MAWEILAFLGKKCNTCQFSLYKPSFQLISQLISRPIRQVPQRTRDLVILREGLCHMCEVLSVEVEMQTHSDSPEVKREKSVPGTQLC